MLPYGQQSIDADDLAAVAASLGSGWLTTGPQVAAFEEAFAQRVGGKHAIAVNNGTSALQLAMLVAGIGAGDRVVTSPNTFLASANAAAYVGAIPDFADIDPVSYTLCPDALAAHWQDDTRAVVAVDYAGQACDFPALAAVAKAGGATIIEDACHGVGGAFDAEGQRWPIGGHPWADITTYSFHPVKTMTTGEGGMLVTDHDGWAAEARRLRHHGMVRDRPSLEGLGDPAFAEYGPWYYEMQELGFNFRITDFQCALGISQLAKLDRFLARRRQIVQRYNEAFADFALLRPPQLRRPSEAECTSWHLYSVQIDFAALGKTRTEVMQAMQAAGVGSQVLYIPVHLQPWYRRQYGYGPGKCPVAEAFYQQTLSLPLYPAMSDADITQVIEVVGELVEGTAIAGTGQK